MTRIKFVCAVRGYVEGWMARDVSIGAISKSNQRSVIDSRCWHPSIYPLYSLDGISREMDERS